MTASHVGRNVNVHFQCEDFKVEQKKMNKM